MDRLNNHKSNSSSSSSSSSSYMDVDVSCMSHGLCHTVDTGVLGGQVGAVVRVARVEVMQHGVGDVDLAASASGTSPVQVPEHVLRAAGHVGGAASAAAAESHSPVVRALHQQYLTDGMRTVGHEVLRLAVVYHKK